MIEVDSPPKLEIVMAVCPSLLISFVEGVYTYQCVDCATTGTSVRQSDHPLQCGCAANPDCMDPNDPIPPAAIAAPSTLKSPPVPASATGAAIHRIDADLISKGVAGRLPANFVWPLPSAEIDPEFAGEKSFHVLKIGGTERFIRLLKARIPSPTHLLHALQQGKKRVVSPIPEFELSIGQETDLPPGLTPLKLTVVGKMKAGTYYVQAKRGGAKANPTVFHILLSQA